MQEEGREQNHEPLNCVASIQVMKDHDQHERARACARRHTQRNSSAISLLGRLNL